MGADSDVVRGQPGQHLQNEGADTSGMAALDVWIDIGLLIAVVIVMFVVVL